MRLSYLSELIEKFCGDGVEWREIGEVCDIQTGKLNANAMNENGKYLFFTCNEFPSRIDTYAFDGKAIMISGNGSNVGHVNYYEGKFNAYQRTYVLLKFDECINVLFLFYYLKSNLRDYLKINSKKGSVPYITLPVIKNFKIPIPPIEVQKEIVRILDKFTNLIYELTRELTLRKKQYEYYRDKLLTFGDDVPRVKLGEVCTNFIVPMRDKPKIFDGDIPWCRIEDIEGKFLNGSKSEKFVSKSTVDKMNLKIFPTGTVICSCSASIGTYVINTKPLITNQTFIGIVVGEKILNTWLRYYLETQTKKLILLANSSTIPYISKDKFKELLIPLPPLEEQERIANILDKFDKLCNDISEGIPAEIEMRQKQYEYYRDKLLTFEPKRY